MQSFTKIGEDKVARQQPISDHASSIRNQTHSKTPKEAIQQEIDASLSPSHINQAIRYRSQRSDIAEQFLSSQRDHTNNQISMYQRSLNLERIKPKDGQFALDHKADPKMKALLQTKQSYLQNLNLQITRLKHKMRTIEHANTDMQYHSVEYKNRSRALSEQNSRKGSSPTVERIKQRCGKIFKKEQVVFNIHEPKESTYFKWIPLVDETLEKYGGNAVNEAKQGALQKAKKSISSYRTRQRVLKNVTAVQANQGGTAQQSQTTEENRGTVVSVFRWNVADWQIKNISDNFRYKIMKKLQIPAKFPLDPPSAQCSVEEYQKLARKVYEMFGVGRDVGGALIVRKFKNGIYFQLKPDRNVVWYFSGVFYLGNWETDLPSEGEKNGFGFQYVPGKYIYLGYFKSGMRHGQGVIKVFPSAKGQENEFMGYDGEWVNGKPHGQGRQIDELNTRYIGQFEAGEQTGRAIILSNEDIYYEGEVDKGLKHGTGMERLANGDTYTGQFAQGKFNGKGIYKWKNGSVYEGQFVKGLRQGKGCWKSSNGDQFEGQYLQDVKHGYGRFKWANGQLYYGCFKADLRQGEGTYRHPNGKTGKFQWQHGKIVHRLYSKEQQRYRCRALKQKGEA